MGLRDIEATLHPGFRFCPTDEELVCHYLYKKIVNDKLSKGNLMVEVNLHLCEPWQLPDSAKVGANEWYFFSFRDRKYATGFRSNRATTNGFWKATGKDRPVLDPTTNAIVGMRKTLVFYLGRAPNGVKTGWVMHEFRLENQHLPPKEDWVLCRVIHKAKEQTNTNQYGLEDDSNTTFLTSSPKLSSSSQVCQTMPVQYQTLIPDHQDHNLNTWSPTFLEHPHEEVHEGPVNQITSSRSGDQFLFDLCLERTVMGKDGTPYFDEMEFEDDSSIVLL